MNIQIIKQLIRFYNNNTKNKNPYKNSSIFINNDENYDELNGFIEYKINGKKQIIYFNIYSMLHVIKYVLKNINYKYYFLEKSKEKNDSILNYIECLLISVGRIKIQNIKIYSLFKNKYCERFYFKNDNFINPIQLIQIQAYFDNNPQFISEIIPNIYDNHYFIQTQYKNRYKFNISKIISDFKETFIKSNNYKILNR